MKPLHFSVLFTLLNHIMFSGMRFSVALDAIHMQASPLVVGIFSALFSLLPTLISVPMGRLIDRKGSRVLTPACAMLLVLCGTVAFSSDSLLVLALVSTLNGGIYITLHIINQQQVGRLGLPQERPANFALSATGFAVSSAIAPIVCGFAIDHFGFRYTFLMLGAVPLLSMLIIAFKKLPELNPRPAHAKAVVSGASVLDFVRDRELRRLYVVAIIFAASWDVFYFMTPVYGAQLGISASLIGLIIGAFSVAAFMVRLLAKPIVRRFTPWQLLIMSLVVVGTGNLVFGLVAAVSLLIAFAFIMGLGQGLATPMMNTLLYESAPPHRVGEAMGFRTSISMGCQLVLPMAAGGLGTLVGIAPLFWLLATIQVGWAYTARSKWHQPRP